MKWRELENFDTFTKWISTYLFLISIILLELKIYCKIIIKSSEKPVFYFSITVDNTYDNIDNVVEVHNQHEEDFEPEETYIIPNCPVACREASQAEGRPGQSMSLSMFLVVLASTSRKTNWDINWERTVYTPDQTSPHDGCSCLMYKLQYFLNLHSAVQCFPHFHSLRGAQTLAASC